MKSKKKTVALIYGGEGCEHGISVRSAANLRTLIDRALYTVLPVLIERDGCWYISENDKRTPVFPTLYEGRSSLSSPTGEIHIDCAVVCLHGDRGEDGVIQGALTAAHIPYIGQDVYAAAMSSDKAFTKLAAERLGIPTARWRAARDASPEEAEALAEELGYPVFIKPTRLGSSIGAHPIESSAELREAYAVSHELSEGGIIIEEKVDVLFELECAFFEDGAKIFSPLGRIDTDGAFYGFGEKYYGGGISAAAMRSEGTSEKIYGDAVEYSRLLTEMLGIRMLARIDFFVTRDGKLIFNEINTFPGMTDTSLYPILTERMGLKRGEFINRLIARCIA